jgi:capsular exopolysaccharide synthesis family protein
MAIDPDLQHPDTVASPNGTVPATFVAPDEGPTTPGWASPHETRPERLLRTIRSRPLVFVLFLVLVPAIAIGVTLAQQREYVTGAQVLLINTPQPTSQGPIPADRASATSAAMLKLPGVAEQASRDLGNVPVGDVRDAVDIRFNSKTDLATVEARDSSAKRAADIADAYAGAYIAVRQKADAATARDALAAARAQLATVSPNSQAARDLNNRIDRLRADAVKPEPAAAVVQQAPDDVGAESLPLLRNGLLGLLGGLILGVLMASLLERFDRRLKTIEQFEELYELPVIARVPNSRSLGKSGRRGQEEALNKTLGFSEEAEAFRALRANLRYFNVDRQVKSVLVASPLSGDGKSTVARYLAITMAAMGDRVCLVNADLRKVDATGHDDGLSLVLAGFDLDRALIEVPITFDAVTQQSRMLVELPAGPLPPNPSELIESARMRWLIHELERRYDVVLIDSPALMTVSDALSLVPETSGVLVVGALGRTTRRSALDLRKQLALLRGRPLGLVANFWTSQKSEYYYDRAGAGR